MKNSDLSKSDCQDNINDAFPLFIRPRKNDDNPIRIINDRDTVLKKLNQCGAIVFKGFPISDGHEFNNFVTTLQLINFSYEKSLSNALRLTRGPRVFTANEAPSTVEIYLHHELAQTPSYPAYLFLFCEQAAWSGGETPLCRSDILLKKLHYQMQKFIDKCRALGARYTLIMPGDYDSSSGQGRSWRQTLSAETKEAAEVRLSHLGYRWFWLPDDSIKVISPSLPLIRRAPSGQEVFFNQLIAAFNGWKNQRGIGNNPVTFGDGSEISEDDLSLVTAYGYEDAVDFSWENGDIIMINNYLVMHGRRSFEGKRTVLASLAKS